MSIPLQTAICSFGMSGKVFHAPFIHANPNFNLYGVWERSKKTAQQFYPEVKSFDTLEEMLSDQAIELVIINTPNVTHFEYAKKALQAGKHIIVEKPFVINTAEGIELIELAAKQKKKMSVYHNRRFDSDFRLVRKVVQGNWLGETNQVEIRYDRFKEQLSPKLHKETPGPGAGLFYDLGSHLIDQSLQLFGLPQAVFADLTILRPISKVDDYFEVILYYNRKRVILKASNQVREGLPAYVLHGSKGSFIKSRTDIQENDLIAGKAPDSEGWGIEPEDGRGLLHTERNNEIVRELVTPPQGNYIDYFSQFYRAVRFEEALPVTAEEGLDVIRVIEAAIESSRDRRVVAFNSSK
ncbi:Gfo/Idh/MocA family oxidoreductase [Segetibacter aerophilus]|uniref:Oxidoreductase n=1 Tax=Segetibacter aerophilus TaxID=670293 RepID=A0A512BFU7_9BACT|nr:Gfo/Idh/MocA family oxidoreductase [Segetibacter aerophilus]GEO10836.1 oxidoreductase [Segetibacter aerophilus]